MNNEKELQTPSGDEPFTGYEKIELIPLHVIDTCFNLASIVDDDITDRDGFIMPISEWNEPTRSGFFSELSNYISLAMFVEFAENNGEKFSNGFFLNAFCPEDLETYRNLFLFRIGSALDEKISLAIRQID